MTIVSTKTLCCDGGGGLCQAEYDISWLTDSEVQAAAGRDGWAYKDGQDLCPDHSVEEAGR